jgi:arginyl-tRNA synthetase
MNIQEQIEKWIKDNLKIEGNFTVEYPSIKTYGDYSTNVALVESKKTDKNPKELAEEYLFALRQAQGDLLSQIEKIEIAGPGFINFFLKSCLF